VKRCFKCGVEKQADEFYKHPMMADGHLGKCKDCTKLDMRRERLTNPRVRQYDRDRSLRPHRVALRARVTKEWMARHPDRRSATSAANKAVRVGKLVAPRCCEGCGLDGLKLSKHHHDYTRPLVVMWLCKPCHALADKLRRLLERAS